LCESGRLGLLTVARFVLRRRHIADRLQQAAGVEPVHPVQRGKLNGRQGPRRRITSALKRPITDSANALL